MAVKRRNRRSKKAGKREQNGRLSRRKCDVSARGKKAEAETMSVAVSARVRQQGISRVAALDPRRGSALGVLRVTPKPNVKDQTLINQAQFLAGLSYATLHEQYQVVEDSHRLKSRSASDYDKYGGGGVDPEDPDVIQRHKRIRARYRGARRAMLTSGPFGIFAIQQVIDDDKPPGTLLPDLIKALDALDDYFSKGGDRD